eukprot:Hpha_TRINITY_DN16336_c0_g2::TRINITY_DN16336_c0_g2_i1::g.60671::m.60671
MLAAVVVWGIVQGGIRINVGTPMPGVIPVSRNFVSFSVEVTNAVKLFGEPSYAQALLNLRKSKGDTGDYTGPLVRIGGNSADKSCWVGAATAGECKYHNITDADFDAYKQFVTQTAKAVNTKLILDINFGLSPSPADLAVPYAKAATKAGLWGVVDAVEIGNEQNLYANHGEFRNASWSFSDYEREFTNYAVSLVEEGGVPKGIIRGGTWCCDPKGEWATGLANHLKSHVGEFNSFSLHQYAASWCNKDPTQNIWGQLHTWGVLHSKYYQNVSLAGLYETVREYNIPVVLGEGNSASCGGIPGISDTWQSTLWALDFLPLLAQANAAAMHFHGGPTGYYTPIGYTKDTIQIRPVYYALLAFAELTANHGVWLSTNYTNTIQGDIRCSGGILNNGVCCAASCGRCGGTNCGNLPGGASNCCSGSIKSANNSCYTHNAPCLIGGKDDYPIIVHAVWDKVLQQTRILAVSKSLGVDSSQSVHLCGSFGNTPTATYILIQAPSYHAAYGDNLRYGGQTFDNSTDGTIQGTRQTHNTTATPQYDGSTCFEVVVPMMGAVLMTVAH